MTDQAINKKATHKGKSRFRERAAVLLVTLPTVKQVADELGIGEKTLYRWKKEPDVVAMMQEARTSLMQATTNALVASSLSAVQVLVTLANSPLTGEAARVTASSKVLEFSYKAGVMASLEERLAALETVQEGEQQ